MLEAIDVVMLAVVLPKPRRLGLKRVHHDQKFQFRQGGRYLAAVWCRQQDVEALAEIAIHLAFVHQLQCAQNVVSWHIELRQPVVGKIIFGGGSVAPHRLLEADEELLVVLPITRLVGPQRLKATRRHVGVKRRLLVRRNRQITWNEVRHQANVRKALDVGMTSQCVHATAADAHIAEDELQHRHAADVLRAAGVLGPAKRVHRRHRLVLCGTLANHFADFEVFGLRRAADAFDQFRRID